MKTRNVLFTVLISAVTSLAVMFGYSKFYSSPNSLNFVNSKVPANYAGFFDSNGKFAGPSDFVEAAKAAIPTVVHIKTKTNPKQISNNLPNQRGNNPFSQMFPDDLFQQFFGQSPQRMLPQRASGSGVIISSDGYIVTNNHVVAGADDITVTASTGKTYKAKVIAADPNYDLAVIKIDASNLPFLLYGNSADVQIGQWVLAIGYPLTLNATVTAGIISAKGQSLGLNSGPDGSNKYAVESYLQTDAAVNPGNSGGALINTNGQLIGINSAIASPTGYYSGYSYAIPVDIVKKVVNDLIKYGSVQRGYLGAMYVDASGMSSSEKEQAKIPESVDGVYIQDLVKDGAAAQAGIKVGDQIRKIGNANIATGPELQEQLSHFRPGDKVPVTVQRGDKLITVTATLKNNAGNYAIVKSDALEDKFGAQLQNLDAARSKSLGLEGGVIVKKINDGVLNDQTRMRDGFIITKANGKTVKNLDDLKNAIGNSNQVTISGVYPGYSEIFEYPLEFGQ